MGPAALLTEGNPKQILRGKPRPYIHFFKKSELGGAEVVAQAQDKVHSGELLQGLLQQVHSKRESREVG